MNRQDRRRARKLGGTGVGDGRGAMQNQLPGIDQMYAAAAHHYTDGRLSEAERGCRTLLAAAPNHVDGINLLGLLAQRAGRSDAAADLFRRALAANGARPDTHFNLGSALLALHRLDEAAHHYREAIALRPNYAEAHNNLGTVLRTQGKYSEAQTCFERARAIQPNAAIVHFNLGNVLNVQGKPGEAIVSLRRAIELEPTHVGAHNNLAIILLAQDNTEEAERSCRRALQLEPNYVEGHINLGNVLKALGRLDEAVGCYQRGLALRPDSAEAHNNLGATLMTLGNLDAAVERYQRAISLSPRMIDAHVNLGKALIAGGNPSAAVTVARRILEMSQSRNSKAFFAGCVSQLGSIPPIDDLKPIILQALTEAWGRPEHLANVAMELVKRSAGVAAVAWRATSAWPERLSGSDLLEPSQWAEIASDRLLRCLLESMVIGDPELERFLTAMRFAMLESAVAVEAAEAVSGHVLEFYCAIARQCFINEYVFDQTDQEIEMAQRLRDVALAALRSGTGVPAAWLAVVAAYYPLQSLDVTGTLLGESWPAAVEALLTQQIREPAQELALRDSIQTLTSIDDSVSRAVRQQYEENPYPRWVSIELPMEPTTVDGYLRRTFPLVRLRDLDLRRGPDILIAGCGTGRHSIDAARRFQGARILAVDLSLTSLCYAKRKTQELGVANIEYAQADILELGSLARSFDVVEAIGVLHHLADPFRGWEVLLSLLRPGGLMFLGLYSGPARREITEARGFLAARRFGSSAAEVRRGRRELAAFEDGKLITRIAKFSDYCSTSGCRDLLFHVQEHTLTLGQISEFFAKNGLMFIGFDELPQWIFTRYRTRFPHDRAMTDLGLWSTFEEEHPDTFVAMYQFWLQKQ